MELRNPVKDKLLRGESSIGSWCLSGQPLAAEALAGAGFEWICTDIEHFPIDVAAAADCFRAIRGMGAVPFARLPACDPIWIKRFCDAGAMGVIIPLIRSADDARRVVQWSRFPPMGRRPWGGGRVMFLYGRDAYLGRANDAVCVLVQIETPEAVADLDAICAVEGIDGCFVGPNDLALAMHLPLPGTPHAGREQLVRSLAERIRAAGKIAGTVSTSPAEAAQRIDEGYQMVSILGDLIFIRTGGAEAVAEMTRRGIM